MNMTKNSIKNTDVQLSSHENLRKLFFEFFKDKMHTIVPSSNLIINNDDSLLFTNAGMNQFKDILMLKSSRNYKSAVSIQKCLRVGGKHNDLDNVGFTKRHHTFFEMMGNFSFYDYFKKEAINYAWEFLTEVLKLDKNRLWITIFHTDEESKAIWSKIIDQSRIIEVSTEDNFWSMGETGPCGPCSEIMYDLEFNDNNEPIEHIDVITNGNRFLEIWNLVFMSFEKTPNGKVELSKKSIDTGMGLERILSIIEGKKDNYLCSLLMPIMEKVESLCKEGIAENTEGVTIPLHIKKICTDHIRTICFLMSEGLKPSNGGHGYILRKIIRRAVYYYYQYTSEPLLYKLIPLVQEIFKNTYDLSNLNSGELKEEEEMYIETLLKQKDKLQKYKDQSSISGDELFLLHDTYGININFVQDYARAMNMDIDYDGFLEKMHQQKIRSGHSFKIEESLFSIFTGYDNLECLGNVIGLYSNDGQQLKDTSKYNEFIVFLDQTTFYAEKGGQAGDKGIICYGDKTLEVINTRYYEVLDGQAIGHTVKNIYNINLPLNVEVKCIVNEYIRNDAARNHSATHMLASILNRVLKNDIVQCGSYVNHEYMRLDFNYDSPLTEENLKEITVQMNNVISMKVKSSISFLEFDEAKSLGYGYLPNTYYPPVVRCVNFQGLSKELCGGTHVNNTSDILGFFIVDSCAIRAGVRRITAITGSQFLKKSIESMFVIRGIRKKLKLNVNIDTTNYESIIEKLQNNEKKEEPHIIKAFRKNNKFLGLINVSSMDIYDSCIKECDIVVLLCENGGIIVGDRSDSKSHFVEHIKQHFECVGKTQEDLFRGRIKTNKKIDEVFLIIESLLNK